MAYEPLKRLSNLNANLQEGLAASKRIFSILDLKPVIQNPASSISLSETIEGRIVFDKVSFAYNKHHMALKNVSFTVEPGKTVAFVGPSGAGKSTLINLIPRFYDVSQGKILINGTDIRSLKLSDLRSLIGLVSQEILLFDDTVSHNIAYGDEKMMADRVAQAAKEAAADSFIQKLSEGYNTRIGENGIQLSGGQRQRIAFARAMYKNAPILLLDEATSSLDSESEKRIQTSLRKLMKGRTTLIVAHRLSTIMDADKIYVLENGMIVEEGNHIQLLEKNGLYAQLWQIQSA
jgi:subfamily B ATP-binding cassette protein MsbA